ncbi:MAG: U32 family peptidase C-terminal domain-containing protein [Trichococcus flocculiformis]
MEAIWNEHDEAIDRAPNAMMIVKMKVPFAVERFDMIRKKK